MLQYPVSELLWKLSICRNFQGAWSHYDKYILNVCSHYCFHAILIENIGFELPTISVEVII